MLPKLLTSQGASSFICSWSPFPRHRVFPGRGPSRSNFIDLHWASPLIVMHCIELRALQTQPAAPHFSHCPHDTHASPTLRPGQNLNSGRLPWWYLPSEGHPLKTIQCKLRQNG